MQQQHIAARISVCVCVQYITDMCAIMKLIDTVMNAINCGIII